MLILCPTFRCITSKKVSKPAKKATNKETTVDPIRCLPVMKLTRSVFAHKRQLCPPVLSYSFERTARLVEFGNFWHKSVDQSSLEDQDKQQIGFFVIRFTVKSSDRLLANFSFPTHEGSGICLPVSAALLDPRAICDICALFWTPRNLFYTTHGSSVCFLT